MSSRARWLASLVALVLLSARPQACSCRSPPWPHRVLLLGLHGSSSSTSSSSSSSVVYVANMSEPAAAGIKVPVMSLLQALRDTNATEVGLLTNYTVEPDFQAHANDNPTLMMQRNVTLKAAPGLMPLLDFQFMRSIVQICEQCWFRIQGIAIANERRGNGASVDFFVGVPGSVLVLQDSFRLRLACTSSESTEELINREQPRSPRFPLAGGRGPQKQVLVRHNASFHGHDYVGMVHLEDYSYDVPPSFQEGKGIVGGFNMRTINTTRLCFTTINATCLKFKSPDACVNEAIDALLAAQEAPTRQPRQQQQQPSSTWLVAVIVPTIIGAALLLVAMLVGWVMCTRHRHQHELEQDKQLLRNSKSSGRDPHTSSSFGPQPCGSAGSKERISQDSEDGGPDPFLERGLGEPRLDQGWEVVAVNTSPSVGSVGNCKIYFGPLLGSGSFGRVYKGRWAGREVAIKCIEHDSDTSKAVENEVQLMLAMDNENIVKAYHYITYTHTIPVSGSDSTSAAPKGTHSTPGFQHASNTASPRVQAAGSKQTQEQQRQLQQLQKQLHVELGPRHQWLLDMGLGFFGPGAGAAAAAAAADGASGSAEGSSSTTTSSSHTSGAAGAAVSSSPAVTSSAALSPRHLSRQSTEEVSGNVIIDIPDGQSSGTPQLCQALGVQGSEGGSGCLQEGPACMAGPWPEQQQQQHQPQQQAQAQPQQQQQQPPQQQQAAALEPTLSDITSDSDGAYTSSHPGSQHSSHDAHGHPTSGNGSCTSGGQPLTPNQRVQLQQHLMRQQHLLHSSGMRARSASSLPPLNGNSNGGRGSGGSSKGEDAANVRDSTSTARMQWRQLELQRSRTYIVQEYCDLGTLTSYATKTLTDPSEDEQLMHLLVLLIDAARGVAALHSKNVVHGDVNARNVLVSSSSDAAYGAVAKLADLGLSRVIRQQATHKTTNTVGTLSHMPPEMLRHGRMSSAVDIYSFGIMLWELFTAQPAFRHLHYGQFFECIVMKDMRPNVPEDMPRDYSLLMLSCWSTNPADRPTANQLLEMLQHMLQERHELLRHEPYSSSGDRLAACEGVGLGLGAQCLQEAQRCSWPGTAAAAAAGLRPLSTAGEQRAAATAEPEDCSSDGSSLHLRG